MRNARFQLAGFSIIVGIVVLSSPLRTVYLWTIRGCCQVAELIGVMKPGGALGGQVMGFNFQREPEWVHWAAYVLSAAAAYGPLLVIWILAIRWRRGSCRWTLCGACGAPMRGLIAPCCPACGAEF